jgi:UDP-glucose 4-epimerase
MNGSVDVIAGDVRDVDLSRSEVDGCEVVFHYAAEDSVPQTLTDLRMTYETNVIGILNLLLAALDAGRWLVVFASSCAVYDDAPELP